MKRWSIVLAVAALSMMVVGTNAEAARTKHRVGGLKGKIISVAADGSSIVIGHSKKKSAGGGTTIQIAANPSVTIDGIGGKRVADLEAGENVVVNPTSGAATTIIAKHAHAKKTKKV